MITIGTTHQGYEIIAAVPFNTSEYAVTATRRLPNRHAPEYVTWATDGKGVYYWGHYFNAHDQSPAELRDAALADMLNRAGYGRFAQIGAGER